MAKANMLCPFSGGLCRDCPLYRGRHFYLCFCTKYRGHLTQAGKTPPAFRRDNGKFKMPRIIPSAKSVDPFKDIQG
jgi:hypothetical protein